MNKRKYYYDYQGKDMKICVQRPGILGFFSSPIETYGCYFYEEDGRYYEFFSGELLSNGTKGTRLDMESTLNICIAYSTAHGFYSTHELSADKFAEKVRPLMQYREEIAQGIREILLISHQNWKDEQTKKKQKLDAASVRKNENEKWLESVLNAKK